MTDGRSFALLRQDSLGRWKIFCVPASGTGGHHGETDIHRSKYYLPQAIYAVFSPFAICGIYYSQLNISLFSPSPPGVPSNPYE
jgi:hypothetical protein